MLNNNKSKKDIQKMTHRSIDYIQLYLCKIWDIFMELLEK